MGCWLACLLGARPVVRCESVCGNPGASLCVVGRLCVCACMVCVVWCVGSVRGRPDRGARHRPQHQPASSQQHHHSSHPHLIHSRSTPRATTPILTVRATASQQRQHWFPYPNACASSQHLSHSSHSLCAHTATARPQPVCFPTQRSPSRVRAIPCTLSVPIFAPATHQGFSLSLAHSGAAPSWHHAHYCPAAALLCSWPLALRNC